MNCSTETALRTIHDNTQRNKESDKSQIFWQQLSKSGTMNQTKTCRYETYKEFQAQILKPVFLLHNIQSNTVIITSITVVVIVVF